jgi:hypothetical protein
MKILVGLIFLIATATHADDKFRTFTANDGRTLKARILVYDAATDKVQIQREDQKKLTVSTASFSEKDQTYIKKWHAAQIFNSAANLKLEIERVEVKSSKKEHEVDISEELGGGGRRGGGETGMQTVAIDKSTQYKFNLLMDNKSDLDLKNITMEYRIFYEQQKAVKDEKANKGRQEDDPRPERYMAIDEDKIKEGKVRIKPFESRSSKQVSTGSVILMKRSASRAWGDKIDLKSNLIGAWIKLTMKGPDGETLVREIATSNSIPEKYSWDTPQEEEPAEEEPPPEPAD